MSDIFSRLKELGLTKGMPESPKARKSETDLFRALQLRFPDGFTAENENGPYFLNRKKYPISVAHGCVRMDQPLYPSDLFSEMINCPNLRIERTLAMDTETSGLSVGAGGFVFMIGMGYYSGAEYIVDQLILPDLAYESAFLSQIEATFARFSCLLTYNGKSFDLPMIQNRANFHFMPDFCQEMGHIDLLHIARRYWKKTLGSVRLSDMETRVLALQRGEEETPGFMAPELYREFLSGGDARAISGVAYHNEIDVVSLSALLLLFSRLAAEGQENQELLREFHVSIPDLMRLHPALFCDDGSFSDMIQSNAISRREKLKLADGFIQREDYAQALNLYRAMAESGDYDSCYRAARLCLTKLKDKGQAAEWLANGMRLIEADPTIALWSKQALIKKYLTLKKKTV